MTPDLKSKKIPPGLPLTQDDAAGLPPIAVVTAMPGPATTTSPMSLRRMVVWGLKLVGSRPGLFILATLLATSVTFLTQANAWLVAQIVNGVNGKVLDGRFTLTQLAIAFAVVGIGLIPFRFLSQLVSSWSNTTMQTHLQQVMHDRLLTLSSTWHDKHGLGDTTQMMNSAFLTARTLGGLLAFPLVQCATLTSAVILLLGQVNQLGQLPLWADVVLIGVLLLVPLGGWWLAKPMQAAFDLTYAADAAIKSEFVNSASKPIEVQVLGAATQRSRSFGRRLSIFRALERRAAVRQELANLQGMVPTLLTTLLLVFAAFSIAANPGFEAGPIIGIYMLVPMVTGPVSDIVHTYIDWVSAWPTVAKVGELLDAEPRDVSATSELADGPLGLALDHVRFAYGARTILNDVSFTFPPGQITAVVGRAGSGKSSLFALIAGLRAPDAGQVSIDETPIAHLSQDVLRKAVAVVSQFPLFVDDTIRVNFQLAKEGASDSEIMSVARETGLLPILEQQAANQALSSDRVLDAMMGRESGQGNGMSGGQRRLFAVTRMLLRQPQILLLDEPMTGIDNTSIELIIKCLQRMHRLRTIVLIEHNMSVVQGLADRIGCLEEGRLVDIGTPAELAARPSLFRELLEAQARISKTHDNMDVVSVPLPTIGLHQDLTTKALPHEPH
jgi:ABC-type multidrug transport system fused ATPase/permease subunit